MMKKILSNWKSGFTMALLMVPVSISLAVASHVPPTQVIITMIWASMVASLFGGSKFNVIGPTGALSGIIAASVMTDGVASVSMLAILAGVIILGAYLLHAERYLVFIPSSVIHGFTLGVACIIALGQLKVVLGLPALPVHTTFFGNVWEALRHSSEYSGPTVMVFFATMIILMLLKRYAPQLPGAIVLSPLGILFGYVLGKQLHLELLGDRYGSINVALYVTPTLVVSQTLLSTSIIVALVAILETMLAAKVADNITKTRHAAHKELLGLGLANITSGLAGGIPAAGALARAVMNIRSGATDATSATLASVFVAVLAVLCLPFFIFMPTVIVGAILVNVALNMVERERLGRLLKYNKVTFLISLLVACITVYQDPMMGILSGALISMLLFVEELSQGYYELTVEHNNTTNEQLTEDQLSRMARRAGIMMYTIKGKLAYINSQAHSVRLETELPKYDAVLLNLKEMYFIDIDGIDTLDEIIEMVIKQHKPIALVGMSPLIKNLLKSVSRQYHALETQGMIFDTVSEAIKQIRV